MRNYVLVVEDHKPALGAWRRGARRASFVPLLATSLSEARERLAKISPAELVGAVIDVYLSPHESGLTLIPEIRSRWPRALVIVCTGRPEITEAEVEQLGARLFRDYDEVLAGLSPADIKKLSESNCTVSWMDTDGTSHHIKGPSQVCNQGVGQNYCQEAKDEAISRCLRCAAIVVNNVFGCARGCLTARANADRICNNWQDTSHGPL